MDKVQNLFKTIIEACQEVKAEDLIALDLRSIESYSDFILIGSAQADRQCKAIADRVLERVFEHHKRHPLGVEGFDTSQWILIDFGDVVCHIFSAEVRDVYHLEDMWPQLTAIPEADFSSLIAPTKPKPKLPVTRVKRRVKK